MMGKSAAEENSFTLPMAITMGCPVGIGPEIILKLFSLSTFDSSKAVVIGDLGLLQHVSREMGMNIPVVEWQIGSSIAPGALNVYSVSRLDIDRLEWGKPGRESGIAMAYYIEQAVEGVREQIFSGIVTCPISKYSLQLAGYMFPGHTEMLAHLTSTDRFLMMMAGARLRVVLVTIHEPVRAVSSLLTVENIFECITMTLASLKNDFKIDKPRIAVAGFNPHGGESGLFGDEEQRIIAPAVRKAQGMGEITGPVPPDTVFYLAAKGMYDAVIAMYHDQGLIPFKLLHFDDGVNVTLGLPIVRTSVDHGTAYDLAGKWKASELSLLSAVNTAEKIIHNRRRQR